MRFMTTVKALVAVILANACWVASAQAADTVMLQVNLGFAGPLTGLEAHFGRDMQRGLRLAIHEANAMGIKLDGKVAHFHLISRDDQADPETAVKVAQQLVDKEVRGVLGHFNSGTTIAASQVYHDAGLPQIAMATAVEYTNQGYDNTFRMMTSDAQSGRALGKFIVETLHAKKVALIDDQTAYGQGLTNEVKKTILAEGGTIVRREYTTDSATDFNAILTNIQKSAPDAIFFGGLDAQSGPMKRQLCALGMHQPFVSGDTTRSQTFINLAGKAAAEGTYASSPGIPLTSPAGVAFVKAHESRPHQKPLGLYAPYAYDGAWNMIRAMQAANSSDPSNYLPALRALQRKGVTSDHIAYDEQGNLKQAAVTIYKVVGGKWQPFKTVRSEEAEGASEPSK